MGQNSLKSIPQKVNFTVCKLKISTNLKKGNISFLGIMLFHTHSLDNKSRIEKSWNVLCFKKVSWFCQSNTWTNFHWIYFKSLISTGVWRKTFPALLFFYVVPNLASTCVCVSACLCVHVCFKITCFLNKYLLKRKTFSYINGFSPSLSLLNLMEMNETKCRWPHT